MAPFDGFSSEKSRIPSPQRRSVELKVPISTPEIDKDSHYRVKQEESLLEDKDTVTFKGEEGGEIYLPAYEIRSEVEPEDIKKHQELLAKYFSNHVAEYEELLAYSAKSFRSAFDLTLSPSEVLEKLKSQNKPLVGILFNRLFGKTSVSANKNIETANRNINPETVAFYSSIISTFLKYHPKVVASIENEYGVVVGKEINRTGKGLDTKNASIRGGQREVDRIGVAV